MHPFPRSSSAVGAEVSGRCSFNSTTVAGAAPASNRLPVIPSLTRGITWRHAQRMEGRGRLSSRFAYHAANMSSASSRLIAVALLMTPDGVGRASRALRLWESAARHDPVRPAGAHDVQRPLHSQPDARADLRQELDVPAATVGTPSRRRLRRSIRRERRWRSARLGRDARHARRIPRRRRLRDPRAGPDLRDDRRAADTRDAAAAGGSRDDRLAGRRPRRRTPRCPQASMRRRSQAASDWAFDRAVAGTGHAEPARRARRPDRARALRARAST